MKLDRLIGILAVLSHNKKVTAPYLAERFEVSRRTISRDIEDICAAGIPVVTTQGAGGGISLMDSFKIDTTVFTEQELRDIFTGLKTLDSVSTSSSAAGLARKIAADGAVPVNNHILIDLSSFYKDSLSHKIELFKQAIAQKRLIGFHYYYNKGEADKLIEPYLIVFKWSSWYVFGFCPERQDFRLYKLNRLWEPHPSDRHFTPRTVPDEKLEFGAHMTDDCFVAALYDASVKYKLVEAYGPDAFTALEDGRLRMTCGFSDLDSAQSWFLGLGDKAEVIDPPELRARIRTAAEKIYEMHQ